LVDAGDSTLAFLVIDLPGGPERFLINAGDCSFTAGSIAKGRFDKLLSSGHLSRVACDETTAFRSGLGVVAARNARLATLKLGPFRHEGLVFSDAERSELGLSYLSRYVVTLDLPNRSIYLRPGKQYSRMEQYGSGGISIARWKEKTIVADVRNGGPAEMAGLKFIDEIISVDRVLAGKTSIFELYRLFAQPGRREVSFIRDGNKMRATVVMQ
jgi:hypothetical protein